ncbi:M23 family metallopeptidase, partial [Flavobacteriaceae bacterium]|nr:M23 family metallopeptidase [Flavobacteriaceae bacterium]
SEEISFKDEEPLNETLLNSSEQNSSLVPAIIEDSLLRAFVANEDKYNPKSNNSSSELNALLFPPAKGPISQVFNQEESHFAVDIVLDKNTPIKAIADGTVIFAEWTAQTGCFSKIFFRIRSTTCSSNFDRCSISVFTIE